MRYEALIEMIRTIACGKEEEWDSSGVQLRSGKEEVDRLLVCLEVTPEVTREAMDLEVDMILSHHPLLFNALSSMDLTDAHHRVVTELAAQGIDVYAAHMTFDKAPLGNSWYLAEILGLDEVRMAGEEEDPLPMVFGELMPSMSLRELYLYTADRMDLTKQQMRMAGDQGMDIRRVAVCAGAGGEFLETARRAGCQALITGDVKYHTAMRAREIGIGLIDAGHYGTERYFAENFAMQLREVAGDDLDVRESEVNIDPFTV